MTPSRIACIALVALTFSVDLSGMAIDFSASVVEDHMTGTLSLQFGEAAFAGTRRKGA